MEVEVLKVVAAGGDLATMAFLVLWLRFDKRVSKLEWQQEKCCGEG